MGFQKGMPRPANAGRKKGSLNKKKVAKISDFLAERGINPAEEALKLIPQLEPDARVKLWMDLHSYCEAKPRQITEDSDFNELEEFDSVSDEELLRIVKSPNEVS